MPSDRNVQSETNFIDSCSSNRIAALSQEQMTRGEVRVSIECGTEIQMTDMHEWIENNTRLFLFLLTELEVYEQDLLASYYLLRKSQESLGVIFGQLQGMMSKKIGDAVHRLTFVVRGLNPYPREPVAPRASPDYFRDPDCLGHFRIDVLDPGFAKLFTQSSNPQRTVRNCGLSLREDR